MTVRDRAVRPRREGLAAGPPPFSYPHPSYTLEART